MLTNLESLLIGYIREFPEHEQVKIFDLFQRFSMAKKHTGELKFDFNWLLEAEEEYDPADRSGVGCVAALRHRWVMCR